MSLARRGWSWSLIALVPVLLALSWLSTAIAQQAGGDGGGPDSDELSILAVLVGLAAVAAVGWLASRRGSSRSH